MCDNSVNLFYIKVDNSDMYVNYVLVNVLGDDNHSVTPNFDFGKENAAVYEEDKALSYINILNQSYPQFHFALEKALSVY